MTRDDVINRLKAHDVELRQLGVERLYLFRSTARDGATDSCDVDLFFDHERGKLGLFELMDVKQHATAILGRDANIMTRRSLHFALRRRIEASAVVVS